MSTGYEYTVNSIGVFTPKIENRECLSAGEVGFLIAGIKDIFGAPTFIVNEKIFWGQDRLVYALDEFFKKN